MSPAIVDFREQPPLLVCSGDEDRATQSLRRRALSRALKASGDVVVDLSGLAFADASFMVDLAMVARRLRRQGAQVLVQGAQPRVAELISHVGLDRLPGVTVLPGIARG